MRKINFKHFVFLFFIFVYNNAFTQVSGISYTISPAGEYTWWDDKAALEDGFMVGGKLGLGFGQFLELRGSYMQSIDMKTDFSNYGLTNFSDSMYTASPVKMTRWGGELKANISKGKLLPFVTFGTGIQSIALDTMEANKQIYLNLGAGIKLSLADRYTLTLEAKNTQYQFNSGKNLLTEEDKAAFDVTNEDFNAEKLRNWSVNASLEFYLGGRRPEKMTELDKIYFNSFSNGFRSLQGTLEPMVAKIDFSDNLPFRNTNLVGANLGVDFGQYIGVRGFYWQSLEDGKADKFDDLAMYGGELRLKLNTQGGIVPYIILGGGNIDVKEEYVGKTMETSDTTSITLKGEDKGFAMGGVGILLPISRNVKVFGSARALLTSSGVLEDTEAPEDIKTSMMYSAGFRFNFGKKAKDPNQFLQANIDQAVANQQSLDAVQAAELKAQYETKMAELEKQLNEAYLLQDAQKAADITREKNQTQAVIDNIERQQVQNQYAPVYPNGNNYNNQQGEIRMTPAEFQNLVDEILDGTTAGNNNAAANAQMMQGGVANDRTETLLKEQELNRKLEEMQKNLLVMQEKMNGQESAITSEVKKDLEASSRRLSDEIRVLEQRIMLNGEKSDYLNKQLQNIERNGINSNGGNNNTSPNGSQGNIDNGFPGGTDVQGNNVPQVREGFIPSSTSSFQDSLTANSFFKKVKYAGMSGFAGFNLGGSNTANVGFRWHYGLGKKQLFEFMPEVFFGFGSPSTYGISANFIAPIKIKKMGLVIPYIGTGFGFMQIPDSTDEADNQLKGAFNIMVGTYLKVWKGRLYVDLTGRNLFKYNQLIAGYRFPF